MIFDCFIIRFIIGIIQLMESSEPTQELPPSTSDELESQYDVIEPQKVAAHLCICLYAHNVSN